MKIQSSKKLLVILILLGWSGIVLSQPLMKYQDILSFHQQRSHDERLLKEELINKLSSTYTGNSLDVGLIGHWADGPCKGVAVIGNIAYFGNGASLEIVDFADPANPVELGKVLIPELIEGIVVKGNFAYIANGYAGLLIIDVTYLNNPQLIGSFDTWNSAVDVAVDSNYAYVADRLTGLQVIDISNVNNLQILGHFDTDDAWGVAINGNYAYIADDTSGLRIIDISNPNMPRQVGYIDPKWEARDVTFKGDYAYVADGFGGLGVINISDPFHPQEVGYCDTENAAYGVAVDSNYAYVADWFKGLQIIDISNPSQPTRVGCFDTGHCAANVAVSGSHAFVADISTGLRVIDVSTPNIPNELGFFETADYAEDIAVSNDYAFVANRYDGLWIVDISDPSHPEEVSCYDMGDVTGVAVRGDYAYIADGWVGLRIIDVSNPSNPIELGYVYTHQAYSVAVDGDYAYVADVADGLRIINIADPSHPREIYNLDTDGLTWDVAVSGTYVYLADGAAGLRILDISNPYMPQEVGNYDTNGSAYGIAVNDAYAYVADAGAGLQIFDISVPTKIRKLGCYDTDGLVFDVAISGIYAYVADYFDGLRVIDVSNPSNPQEPGYFDTAYYAEGLAVVGDHVYVADAYDGFYILDYLGNSVPQSPTLHQPVNNDLIGDSTPSLTWRIPADSDGDALHFKVEIAADSSFRNHITKSPFISQNDVAGFNPTPPVAEGNGSCSFTLKDALVVGQYWWRVSAFDGKEYSIPSDTWKFNMAESIKVVINQIAINDFPTIHCYVSVTEQGGRPIAGLADSNFAVLEDNTVENPILVTPFSDNENLEEIYKLTSSVNANQYKVTYNTHNPVADSSWRTVDINVYFKSLPGHDSSGYCAPYKSQGDSLIIENSWGGIASTNRKISIRLVNRSPVRGIQFNLKPQPNWLFFNHGQTTARSDGFTLRITDHDSLVTYILYHDSSYCITHGNDSILELFYDVSNLALPDTIKLMLEKVVVADTNACSIPIITKDGIFKITGLKGDINNDGERNILDIILIVDFIMGRKVPTPEQHWAADCNDDGDLNILDIELLIGWINGRPLLKTVISRSGTAPSQFIMEPGKNWSGNERLILCKLSSEEAIAGIQLKLSGSRDELELLTPRLSDLPEGMNSKIRLQGNQLLLLFYSLSGSRFEMGEYLLLELPVKMKTECTNSGLIQVDQVIFASESGQSIEVDVQNNLSSTKPDNYHLDQNYPNPFNPETLIKYQIPGLSYVKINVFNLRGQHIRTLVDAQQAPGSYQIMWNGLDDQGQSVSSGVYLYKMQAGDFTAMKKMVLVR